AGLVGIAFALDGVPADLQPFLRLLPELLTQAGVLENGAPIPAAEVLERQRREIPPLNALLDSDARRPRAAPLLQGQELAVAETRRAIAWLERALTAPDWRPENLPRLRDLADHRAKGLRRVTQQPEESWVTGPRDAYLLQEHSVYEHAASFLTAAHDAHRV